MSKKGKPEERLPSKETQAKLYTIAKKSGRSSGPLRKGIYGTMVTPKMYRAQVKNKNRSRARHGLPPLEES
tara:strand:- start:31940 stop:32152 length:213 start_codon:yes stop_codon:yes gene_type:complete